ncbi:hypothetical protein Trydic_g7756 [Trypoxylus dichotomus]
MSETALAGQLPPVPPVCSQRILSAEYGCRRSCLLRGANEDLGVQRRPPWLLPQDDGGTALFRLPVGRSGRDGFGASATSTSFGPGRSLSPVSEPEFRETLDFRCCLLDGGWKPSESAAMSSSVPDD